MKPKKAEKGPSNPLYEKKPKVFGVGQALPPRTPLNRYV
jgi:large subunit ribosomal protein L7Ae